VIRLTRRTLHVRLLARLVLVEMHSAYALLFMRRRRILDVLRRGYGGRVCLCATAGGESVADVLDSGGVEDVAIGPWALRQRAGLYMVVREWD